MLFVLVTLSHTAFSSKTKDPFPSLAMKHLQIGCRLWSVDFEFLAAAPGKKGLCLFVPQSDKVISAGTGNVSMWTMGGALLWTKPISLHHQMNLSRDGKSFLALGDEVHPVGGAPIRFDTVVKIDLSGNVLAEFSFFKHRDEIDKLATFKKISKNNPRAGARVEAQGEHTHANSVYEIPPNNTAAKIAAFAPGNIIVNVNGLSRVLIFDSQLKKILWTFTHKQSRALHDVQVLPNGHLLAYVNMNVDGKERFSSLDEIDPVSGEILWRHQGTPRASFFSRSSGGVQLLEDKYVLSSERSTDGAVFVVDRRTKERIWSHSLVGTAKLLDGQRAIQEAKLGDFSSHLGAK